MLRVTIMVYARCAVKSTIYVPGQGLRRHIESKWPLYQKYQMYDKHSYVWVRID